MLASAGALPRGAGWTYEHKWDGFRALLWCNDGGRQLYSRNGTDLSGRFPELVDARFAVPSGTLLDGELVVAGADGRPVWKEVRRRTSTRRPEAVAAALERSPALLLVFDAPIVAGEDRCTVPLADRRAQLAQLELPPRCQQVAWHQDGDALWQATREVGLEGVVAKRESSRYRPGVRTRDWVKTKHLQTTTMRVVGVRRTAGRVRAVLVAALDGDPVAWVDRWLPSIEAGSLEVGLPEVDGERVGEGVTVQVRHLATPGLREPMIVAVDR